MKGPCPAIALAGTLRLLMPARAERSLTLNAPVLLLPVNSRIVFLLIAFAAAFNTWAQEITVNGTAYSSAGEKLYDLMVVNKRTRTGIFGAADGTFTIKVLRTDTLLLGASGHRTQTITFADSTAGASYTVFVRMPQLMYQLPEFEVLSERTLKEIQEDINKLGYKESDYRISNVDALQSPITFLYQEFSRRERSKRLVAQLRNEDRKRELLRELLHQYVQYDIINLNDEAFDDFIEFCNVPEDVMKGLTQYEFLLYMKKKYELYSSLGPTRQH